MSGWDEAFAAAALHGIEIVPGLELSTVHNGRSLHILGFYPDANKLRVPLDDRLQGRFRRSQEMVEKLAAMGYAIELPKTSPGMAPGRPHIASALVKAGHAKSSREAFDRWLGDDGRLTCITRNSRSPKALIYCEVAVQYQFGLTLIYFAAAQLRQS